MKKEKNFICLNYGHFGKKNEVSDCISKSLSQQILDVHLLTIQVSFMAEYYAILYLLSKCLSQQNVGDR